MSARTRFPVAAIAVVIVSLLSAAPALAQASPTFKVCNQSSTKITVAKGFFTPGVNDASDSHVLTGPFVSEGWWSLSPGECNVFINKFNVRYMFWFAYGGDQNNQYFWVNSTPTDTQSHFCATNFLIGLGTEVPVFTYEDENTSEAACRRAGDNRWVTARRVDLFVDDTANFSGQW